MRPDQGFSPAELHSNKFKQLADKLVNIEISLNKHNNHTNSYVPNLSELSNSTRNRIKLKKFRGKESIFKRPDRPAPKSKINTIPDHRRNPSKWTCYSLADVTEMSDESNKQAATAFLKELQQRKRSTSYQQNKIKERLKLQKEQMKIDEDAGTLDDINMEEDEERFIPDNRHKNVVLFKKSEKKEEPTEEIKPEFRNSKLIMPEYEIGSKRSSKKKKFQKSKIENNDKAKTLKLELLSFDDEE